MKIQARVPLSHGELLSVPFRFKTCYVEKFLGTKKRRNGKKGKGQITAGEINQRIKFSTASLGQGQMRVCHIMKGRSSEDVGWSWNDKQKLQSVLLLKVCGFVTDNQVEHICSPEYVDVKIMEPGSLLLITRTTKGTQRGTTHF